MIKQFGKFFAETVTSLCHPVLTMIVACFALYVATEQPRVLVIHDSQPQPTFKFPLPPISATSPCKDMTGKEDHNCLTMHRVESTERARQWELVHRALNGRLTELEELEHRFPTCIGKDGMDPLCVKRNRIIEENDCIAAKGVGTACLFHP